MAKVTREASFGIGIPVKPHLDEKSSADVLKKLSKLKTSWSEVSKSSKISIKEIREMSAAASNFGKKLSEETRKSYKEIAKLGDELNQAMEEVENLQGALKHADTPGKKKQIYEDLSRASASVLNFKKQIDDWGKISTKQKKELDRLSKKQIDYRQSLESAGRYSGKDMLKDLLENIGRGAKSGGVKDALSGIAEKAGKGAKGGLARTALAGGAGTAEATGIASLAGGLTKAAGAIGIIAAAVGTLWKFISAASEHQTKLNKALLDGAGFVNDFTTDTKAYHKAVDDLREGTQDAAGSLLRFGTNSETAAKTINAFAKESTGSIIKTRDAMLSLGKGDVAAGVEQFSRNAVVYGKALGMEATEVGSMMGKFVSEAGYGADQVQGLMGNIVKAAATANMPMTKFMSIFKSVIPDVELYQNRLEELTGTIKLLSKTMSAKDVKNFMDSFAKGFQGMDFKQRLKTTLITGTDFVSKTLSKDFDMKAKTMAKNFEQYGIQPEDFEKAYKGGEKSMADLIAKAKGNAAKQGKEVSGTDISNAMKLAGYESDRRKGGPLNTATAMRGAGAYSTYKILNKLSQSFTTGFSGLSEHVIKQLGISEQQYEALRSTHQSMESQHSMLEKYGKTESKSMNKALRETIAMRKGIKAEQVTSKDMQQATDEDLFQAAEISNQLKEGQQTAEDLAQEQVSVTTSISEKIDNVIAFLLEKLYRVMQPLLDVLNDIFTWLTGSDDARQIAKTLDRKIDEMNRSGRSDADKEQFKMVAEEIKKAANAGKSGDALADAVAKSGVIQANLLKENLGAVSQMGMSLGMDERDALKVQVGMERALAKGNMSEALKTLGDLPGDLATNIAGLGSRLGASEEAKRRAADKNQFQREAPKTKIYKTVADKKAAQDAGDLETDLEEIGKNTAEAAKAQREIADSPVRMGTTVGTPNAGLPMGASREPSKDAEHTSDATVEVQKAIERAAEEQGNQDGDIYDGIKDVAGILKKGIKYENGWMGNRWRNVLKDATLDAFRQALLEFAILQAKMEDNDELKKALVGYGQDLVEKGATTKDILMGQKDNRNWDDYISQQILGSRQMGGPIPDTGLYKLHRGEYVVPPGGAMGGGAPTTVNVGEININGTNLSQDQLRGAVYSALDDLARKH